jgi:hypothetical protein
MLKRRPETQYTRDGEAIQKSPEPEDPNISTPEEIQKRKMFKAKRVSVQEKSPFILKSKLIAEAAESDLLKDSAPVKVNFFEIKDDEVKENSPEKQKTSETNCRSFEGPKFSNPFNSILSSIFSKKDSEVVDGFISSKVASKPEPKQTSFLLKPIKSDLKTLVSVEGSASVNGVSRGEGFVEVAAGEVGEKKVFSFILKNKIKNLIYQASLSNKAEIVECNDLMLTEDHAGFVEMKTVVFKKNAEKVVTDQIRVCIAKEDKRKLIDAFAKLRQ